MKPAAINLLSGMELLPVHNEYLCADNIHGNQKESVKGAMILMARASLSSDLWSAKNHTKKVVFQRDSSPSLTDVDQALAARRQSSLRSGKLAGSSLTGIDTLPGYPRDAFGKALRVLGLRPRKRAVINDSTCDISNKQIRLFRSLGNGGASEEVSQMQHSQHRATYMIISCLTSSCCATTVRRSSTRLGWTMRFRLLWS